jgi:hypothetical protein
MSKMRIVALALASSIALTAGVSAQGMGRGGGAWMGPVPKLCAKEIKEYCADKPQGPKLRACLEAKSDKLSENCQIAVDSTGPDRGRGTGPVARLCVEEIGKYCSEVEHVAGRVRLCLEKHKKDLGEACVTALQTTGWGFHR